MVLVRGVDVVVLSGVDGRCWWVAMRVVSTLLVPGEERGDGCSGGERDEDYSCENSLLRSVYQWS